MATTKPYIINSIILPESCRHFRSHKFTKLFYIISKEPKLRGRSWTFKNANLYIGKICLSISKNEGVIFLLALRLFTKYWRSKFSSSKIFLTPPTCTQPSETAFTKQNFENYHYHTVTLSFHYLNKFNVVPTISR